MSRQCSRPGCKEPAEATLSFDYAQQKAWVQPLADERHPSSYDLCARHATVGVPVGWDREDLRSSGSVRRGRAAKLAG